MDVTAQSGPLADIAAGAIVVNHFQRAADLAPVTAAVNHALGGAISRLIELGDFTGKLNQVAVLYPGAGALPAQRVLVVGLGKREDFTLDRCRQVAATAARKARDLATPPLATKPHGAGA